MKVGEMTDSLTALASENLNPSLRSLLEDVQRGHIRVPRFQRPFVWTDDQRLELLRSIRDNMPIGSLLIWRTIVFKLASFNSVGPHSIPPIVDKAPATGWQYLLDGHQRVSTLLGLLLSPQDYASLEDLELAADGEFEEIDWDIQYDLIEQNFVFAKNLKKKNSKRPLLPLWTLLDGRLVNKHMREIRRIGANEKWTESNIDIWEERADQLSYRFQQCRIPIVVMVTDDLDLAAKTFQRINSLGTPMDESHLVSALTWRSDFDLRETIKSLRDRLPKGWRKLDDALFLQVCKGLAGLDVTKAAQTELVNVIKSNYEILDKAGSGIERSVRILEKHANVFSPYLLPYSLQLVLMAAELADIEEDDIPEHDIMDWFWRTSWSEVFASATYRIVKSEQANLKYAIHASPNVDWDRPQVIPDRFDFRSARVRLFILRLSKMEGLVDPYGHPFSGEKLLKSYERDALVKLFTAPRGASTRLKRLLQGAGNRFFIDPETASVFRERLKYGPDYDIDDLSSHFIDEEMVSILRKGNLELFLELRSERMENWDFTEYFEIS
jgi:hypothetical protein